MKRAHSSKDIIDFILDNVEQNPKSISTLVSNKFGVSRQSVSQHLIKMVADGTLRAEGNTRNKQYKLQPLSEKQFSFTVSKELKEDVFWRQNILPLLTDLKPNVLEICNFGFTEIFNNLVEHSESKSGYVALMSFPNKVKMMIRDYGVGIFKKIVKELNLEDERHAVLELTKGKLTTDKEHHSGEGIFFASRMFDEFSIFSGTLFFSHVQGDEDNWLLQDEEDTSGTMVIMTISKQSSRTMTSVYNNYTTSENDLLFSRTHVPVELSRYGNEQLVSRSQAKRLLTRLEPFKEVFLNFKGVKTIGQAFADEIFRVYKNEHPNIEIVYINTNNQVEDMIKRVIAGLPGDDQLKLQI